MLDNGCFLLQNACVFLVQPASRCSVSSLCSHRMRSEWWGTVQPTKRTSTYHSNFGRLPANNLTPIPRFKATTHPRVTSLSPQGKLSHLLSSPQIAHLDGKSAKGASKLQDVDCNCFQGALHLARALHWQPSPRCETCTASSQLLTETQNIYELLGMSSRKAPDGPHSPPRRQ